MDLSIFEKQLTLLVTEFTEMQKQSQYNDLSDFPKNDRQSLVSRCIAAIHRITGPSSAYSNDVERLISDKPNLHDHTSSIVGVAQALRDDIQAGHVISLIELTHADIFADFLEMAQYLLDSKYKDAAAVIAGSTLESHLRKLCQKNGVDIDETDNRGNSRPKKADRMNADLARENIYSKLDLKNITAWLDLRNKAAHGLYTEYTEEQVVLLISGIQNFISRFPA